MNCGRNVANWRKNVAMIFGMWRRLPRIRYGLNYRALSLPILVLAHMAMAGLDESAWAGRLPQAGASDGQPVFRGIRPPGRGTRDRFRFYSAPASAAGSGSSGPGPTVRRRRLTDHAWFWDAVPAERAARAGQELSAALDVVIRRRSEQGALVTVDEARSVLDAYRAEIAAAAARHGISPALVVAVIAVESAGRLRAVSPKGAQGLMQLMPATGRRFGVTDPFDAAGNILAGTAYLDWLLREFGEDAVLALAGYNAGEGAVARHGGVPPYSETRNYVVRVLDAFAAARELCSEVPATPRDPCAVADARPTVPASTSPR